MANLKRLPLLILIFAIFALSMGTLVAQDAGQGFTIDTLNVRGGPGTEYAPLTQINPRVRVAIEGRNTIGNWILIHSLDNAIRGWVASRYVAFDEGVNLDDLPVTEEQLAGPVPETPVEAAPPAAQPVNTGLSGRTVDLLNVRSGPGTRNSALTLIGARVQVVLEGRNHGSDWLLIHTPDNAIRGWVSAAYIALDARVELGALPVVDEIVGSSPAPSGPQANTAPINNSPESIDAMHQRLLNTPDLHNITSGTVYTIFRRGRNQGNNPRVFMKVGDSLTALQPFFLGFGWGTYDLGGYGHLQATIDHFSVPLNSGDPNSFTRFGFAAGEGLQSSSALDPTWTNPAVCTVHREPLLCEVTVNKPSVALVLFGTIDVQFNTADNFRANMTNIIQHLVNRGVIPVLSTFPSANWFKWEETLIYNNVILDVAQQFDVPLINLWAATQRLPRQGIHDDGFHLTTWRTESLSGMMASDETSPYRFTGEEQLYGVTLRNLLNLQMLDSLRRNVLGG